MHAARLAVCLVLVAAILPSTPALAATASQRTPAPTVGAPAEPAGSPAEGDVIRDQWIVEVHAARDVDRVAAAAERAGAIVTHRYRTAVVGFAAQMGRRTAMALRAHPTVRSVTPDRVVGIAAGQASPPWGLDRIDQPRGRDATYAYDHTGRGVHVYVLDTGVRADHEDFGGRVGRGFDATGRGSTGDCNGHGTHVAGTIAGTRHGVAKKATIIPVRVLGCSGYGELSWMLRGLDYVVRHHRTAQPAVVNMSAGTPRSDALDRAVRAVIADRVTVVTAAGNEGTDACGTSPARVGAAITVGAADDRDRAQRWSNFGACVDLLAPGTAIRSAWHSSARATSVQGGTSMAAPHVAGAAAMYLQQRPSATPDQVWRWMRDGSTKNALTNLRGTTPNRLLHVPGKVPTTLAVSGPTGAVAIGSPVTFTATLRNAVTGQPLADRRVAFAWTDGTLRSWAGTTDASGKVVFGPTPARPTTYTARHPGTAWSAVVQRPTSLDARTATTGTLTAAAPAGGRTTRLTVTAGTAVDLAGTLIGQPDGLPLAGVPVRLQRRVLQSTNPDAWGPWQDSTSVLTSPSGTASFAGVGPAGFLAPQQTTQYRLLAPSTATTLSSGSAPVRVDVALAVEADFGSGDVVVDQGGEAVIPVTAVIGRAVEANRTVRVQVRAGDDWEDHAGSQLVVSPTDRTRVTGTLAFDTCGSFQVRVNVAAGTADLGGASDPLPITVRGCTPDDG